MKIHCLFDALIDPKELKPSHKNRNKHSDEQIQRLAKILEYQGWRWPVKVSKQSGLITSGHGRRLAAIMNEWKTVPVVYQDYESEDEEYADSVSDNAIASWAELDLSGINIDIPDLGPDFDIDMLGLRGFEIEPADKFNGDADEVPEVKDAFVKRGDLFELGRHRFLCGDATSNEDVLRLMNGEKADMVYTDPPYGLGYVGDFYQDSIKASNGMKRTTNKFKQLEGDTGNWDYDPQHVLTAFDYCEEIFMWGGDYYCWSLPKDGSWICWNKVSETRMDAMPGASFELCWSKSKHKRHMVDLVWRGCFGHNRKTDGDKKVHPTQKPVKLAEWFFERWGKEKTNIVDLYLGSGSTLIACEKTNRKCFGMEIDPHYCSVIIERWQKFTGQKAVKLESSIMETRENK